MMIGIFEKIMLSIIVLMLVTLPFLIMGFNERADVCNKMEGFLVKTPDGYRCFKLEKIEIK